MISAEHQRKMPRAEYLFHFSAQYTGNPRDFGQILRVRIFDLLFFLRLDRQIALIDDLVTKINETRAYAGDSDRGRPHVDSTPSCPEIHRDTNDMDRHDGIQVNKYLF